MPQTVSVGELTDLVVRVFLRHGVSGENAGPVAETVVAAERDGAVSHGLLRLPGYVSTLKSGWVDGRAVRSSPTQRQDSWRPRQRTALRTRPCGRVRRCCGRRRDGRGSPRWRSAIRSTSPPFGPIASRLRPKGSSRWLW